MHNWHVRTAGLFCAAAVALAPTLTTARADDNSRNSVPIVDAVTLSSKSAQARASGAEPVLALHAVRRLKTSTVVYYSVTVPADASADSSLDYLGALPANGHYGSHTVSSDGAIIDVPDRKLYLSMTESNRCAQCSSAWWNESPAMAKRGQSIVGWFSTPPLDAGTTSVDVAAGNRVFHGVPVEDGALTPTVTRQEATSRWTDGLPLGAAWPVVDGSELQGVDVGSFVKPLVTTVGEVSGATRERDAGTVKNLDLDASVLFAKDSDVVRPEGLKVIDRAAKQLAAMKPSGAVTVTGYTDNLGTKEHGLDLSKRRAAAVAKVLGPKLPSGTKIATAGKGEADPVASNDTEEGRRLNRRVTITVAKG
ncbi:OmpA family protein [Cutibacterium avidum]|uniref:OmpA family protein n=1 Tax=Cutibacterium avidum TaxID=33010 RepID=UPI00059FE6EB|nr:OmpA family protein [Cutibacterium avidum]MCO6671652.1 OmpA family protein [Cutibacterium avidum]MDK7697715.1 OmpA family protein [Cutibacterium avidum]MDQ9080265.1 OmpA family protein [Cutibacterium avidum]MDU5023813.1 OmpA family protein [Cutibacterium avidum]OIJ79508.1 hypothetical protein APY06_08910 [Cutibacterium avidum]